MIVFIILILIFLIYLLLKEDKYTLLRELSSSKCGGRKAGTKGMDYTRNLIIEKIKSYKCNQVSWAPDFRNKFGDNYENIAFKLNSDSNSDENIVVMAHYDHLGSDSNGIYYGANDNASGVFVLLELAKKLSKVNRKYNYIFILTDAEEQGRLGAEHIVENEYLANVKFIVNFDMVGGWKENKIDIAISNESFRDKIKNIKTSLNLNFKKPLDRTDYYKFYEKGIEGLDMGHCLNDTYHQIDDTFEKLNLKVIDETIKLVFLIITN